MSQFYFWAVQTIFICMLKIQKLIQELLTQRLHPFIRFQTKSQPIGQRLLLNPA